MGGRESPLLNKSCKPSTNSQKLKKASNKLQHARLESTSFPRNLTETKQSRAAWALLRPGSARLDRQKRNEVRGCLGIGFLLFFPPPETVALFAISPWKKTHLVYVVLYSIPRGAWPRSSSSAYPPVFSFLRCRSWVLCACNVGRA